MLMDSYRQQFIFSSNSGNTYDIMYMVEELKHTHGKGLVSATYKGRIETVQYILTLDIPDVYISNSLSYAIESNNLLLFDIIRQYTTPTSTHLVLAAAVGNLDMLSTIMKDESIDCELALSKAVFTNNIDCVKYIITQGRGTMCDDLFEIMASYNHLDMFKMFFMDSIGEKAMKFVVSFANTDMFNYLIVDRRFRINPNKFLRYCNNTKRHRDIIDSLLWMEDVNPMNCYVNMRGYISKRVIVIRWKKCYHRVKEHLRAIRKMHPDGVFMNMLQSEWFK